MSQYGNRHPSQNDPDTFVKKVLIRLVIAAVLLVLFVAFGIPWLQSKGLA